MAQSFPGRSPPRRRAHFRRPALSRLPSLQVTFNGYWTASQAAFDSTKMVYYQTQTGYGVPQLIRVVWLLPGDPAFTNVWTKADAAVASGKAARSWLWGPAPILAREEQYTEGKNG